MKFFYVLIGLMTTATAVDIRFTNSLSCNGWYAACSNINPGICCSIAASTLKINVAAVPSNWIVRAFGFLLSNCESSLGQWDNRGDLCVGHERRLSSARYQILPAKLARGSGTGEITTRTTGEECQRVDTFTLEDGTKYPINHLNDGEVQYLVQIHLSNTH